MELIRDTALIQKLIFKHFYSTTRFTQDSPVYPDVWLDFFKNALNLDNYCLDLILTPHQRSTSGELFKTLAMELGFYGQKENNWHMASSGNAVVAKLSFHEMITVALPLTNWWKSYLWKGKEVTEDNTWVRQLAGAILTAKENPEYDTGTPEKEMLADFTKAFDRTYKIKKLTSKGTSLWSMSKNRQASISIEKSVPSTKADAARRLFDVDGSSIIWAVLDTGIDATHDSFRQKDPKTGKIFGTAMGAKNDPLSNHTRIRGTYDFAKFRSVIAGIHDGSVKTSKKELVKTTGNIADKKLDPKEVFDSVDQIELDLRSGRLLNWAAIAPLLRIPHNATEYVPPVHPHGTHVAGIIGAGIPAASTTGMIGVCPGIELYDIRVMDENGGGEEFNIMAALQFLRWLNNQHDNEEIHGANLSFSIPHEVASYACGQTPVCELCDRLVEEGIVVVAAAGNLGQTIFQSTAGISESGFRMVNITDPGNSDLVITVGATHRNRPHSYGVSYFSSKGPTGDGRIKPDLVAPGEKIVSTSLNNGSIRMDGTSMAAPHVSGAAALLLCKYRELIGRPRKIKEILCKSATDLGRERYFQGAGMLDILRAMQAV